MSAYGELAAHYHTIGALSGVSAILGWDTQVMMPPGSAALRGEQEAALASVIHTRETDPRIADWLNAAAAESLDSWQQANLAEITRRYAHATALPDDLVTALTKASIHCEQIWINARKDNDFKSFAAAFHDVLNLVREVAAAKSAALGLAPYDALLDQYDPGMRMTIIDPYFAELAEFLPGFIDQVIEKQSAHPPLPLQATIPTPQQAALGRVFMQRFGFDFSHGRIDVSAHPFCGGVPGDVRLTTRYDEANFTDSLYGVFHETGHALYEMGLPPEWHNQPVGEARGMSLHESQSLFVEMQLCRSPDFIAFALPLIREAFSVSGPEWQEDNVTRALTKVERSLIRVRADEATYPLHILLRYELEKALLSGDLAIHDLPGAWDEGMERLLGIRPDTVGNGCLQDIHWPGGAIGYFPTYTIGAMIAAQLMQAARAALPDLSAQIRRGDFTALFGWLRTHIHSKASAYATPVLIAQATGQPLSPALYKEHLKSRYLAA